MEGPRPHPSNPLFHYTGRDQIIAPSGKVNKSDGRGIHLPGATFHGSVYFGVPLTDPQVDEATTRSLEKAACLRSGNALQAASYEGHAEIVQQLLERGADVNAQGGEYGNALQAASAGGYAEIVQQLLERGADVNAQGGRYGNALQAASARRHTEIVQQLLERGAGVNARGGEFGQLVKRGAEQGANVHGAKRSRRGDGSRGMDEISGS